MVGRKVVLGAAAARCITRLLLEVARVAVCAVAGALSAAVMVLLPAAAVVVTVVTGRLALCRLKPPARAVRTCHRAGGEASRSALHAHVRASHTLDETGGACGALAGRPTAAACLLQASITVVVAGFALRVLAP